MDPIAKTVFGRETLSPMRATSKGSDDARCQEPGGVEDRSDRYQLIAEIGAGTMGVVYRAHDSILARDVALKLMKSTAPLAGVRGVREAQALAKVSHPNVVRVYDADALDEGVMLVMEFVEGESLAAWLGRPYPWERRLEVLIAAGEGLRAVHEAGLVHCDFKPGNVLISDNDEVKVADFGLARPSEARGHSDGTARTSSDIDPLHGDTSVFVGGTPAYMSPEQHFGGEVGAHSDQYSFAATLYEALYGDWPYPANDIMELRRAIKRAKIRPPPPDSKVPRRIFAIIARGLASDPAARWPSMEALLTALRRDPARTRRRALGVAGLLLLTSAVSYGLAASSVIKPCAGIDAALEGVWDSARAATLSEAFAASPTPYAEDAWGRIEPRLDAYAEAWTEGRQSACEAQVSGVLSEGLAERQLTCMERRKVQLGTLVDILGTAEPEVIERSVQAVASLPDIRGCTDVDRFMQETMLPGDEEVASAVRSNRELLAKASVLESAGLYREAMSTVREVRTEARDLGFTPLQAEAALRVGGVLLAQGRAQEASKVLELALTTAIADDLHVLAAESGAKWVFALGLGERRFVEARTAATITEAFTRRAQDWRLTALFNNNFGSVLMSSGEPSAAIQRFEVTLTILEERSETSDPLFAVTHHNLGELHAKSEDLDAAEHHYRTAASTMRETLGVSHPMRAHPLAGIGDVALRRGALEIAETHYWQALTLMEEAYGPEVVYVVQPLIGLAEIALKRGQRDDAEAHFRRVVSTCDALSVELEYLATALSGLGELALAQSETSATAREFFERAITTLEALDAGPVELAKASLRAGELAAAAGDVTAATSHFQRALSLEMPEPGSESESELVSALERLVERGGDGTPEREGPCSLLSSLDLQKGAGSLRSSVESLRERACAERR